MIIDKDKPFYSVVQVAEILNITPDRLRTYDEEGIIIPTRARIGKKRLYSEFDIEWLINIRKLISKNRMNIYSVLLVLNLLKNLNTTDIKNNLKKYSDISEILLQLVNNPNYKKVIGD